MSQPVQVLMHRSGDSTANPERGVAAIRRIGSIGVILHDDAADLVAIDRAVAIAGDTHARLTVVVAPLFSRWLNDCGLLAGVMIPEWRPGPVLAMDGVERCVAVTLTRVPPDVPVTIRSVPGARPAVVAGVCAELTARLVVAALPARQLLPRRWHRVFGRLYETGNYAAA